MVLSQWLKLVASLMVQYHLQLGVQLSAPRSIKILEQVVLSQWLMVVASLAEQGVNTYGELVVLSVYGGAILAL